MTWVAPPSKHRVRYQLWKWVHWRRVRRFKNLVREKLRENYLDEMFGAADPQEAK